LGFVFTCDDGSAAIGVVVFVTESLGFWYYNNTLNKLTKADNNTQYYVYDYQGSRVRTVIESNQQTQSQRDYLPALDISINQAKQQSTTLHIGLLLGWIVRVCCQSPLFAWCERWVKLLPVS
jgi:hypothetical protein